MLNVPQRAADILKQLSVAALYALLLYAGEVYFGGSRIVGYFEPASGFALATLLVGGKRYAWGMLLGAILVNAASANPLWVSSIIALSDALQALCGAWLLTREGGFDWRLQSLRDYLRLVLFGGCVSIAAGALVVSTPLLFSGLLTPRDYLYSLLQWWMSDTLGVILITPLILAWWKAGNARREAGKMAEAALLLGLAILAGQVIFLGWLHDVFGQVAKGYWMFMITTWAAVRLGPRETTAVLVMTAAYALAGAIHGTGYFADDIARTHLLNYWLYMAILSVVSMVLATYFSERRLAKEALRIAAIAFRSNDGMMITDDKNTILRVNHAFSEITGHAAAEAVGRTPCLLLDSGRHNAAFYAAMWEEIKRAGSWRGEMWSRRKNGEVFPAQVTITAVEGADGEVTHYVSILHDITERKRAEDKINNLVFYDALTQLPNRRMLNDRISQAMASSKRSGRHAALMFIDLDNFKPLNDMHGHEMGDMLLIQTAQRITGCVREVDTVVRFGGDEFVVVLNELETDKADSAAHAGIVAKKIHLALSKPYLLVRKQEDSGEISIEHCCTSSIGIVLFSGQEFTPEDILKRADMAMYQAKRNGRNQFNLAE